MTEGQVSCGHLFHTYLRAVGMDSGKSFDIGGREMPMADPSTTPIREILA